MRNLIYLVLITAMVSCSKDDLITENSTDNPAMEADMGGVSTKIAQPFNKLFTRYGNGWTGGDATYSVPLPDGRVVWMFGDSFLDTVYADRSRPGSELIRNCFVVQEGTTMTTLVGGTIDDPEALVNTADPANEWYWPGDGTVIDGNLYVFMSYFIKTGPGAWDFAYQRQDLVKFSLPSITEVSRTTVWDDDPDIAFGTSLMEDSGYIYIYGTEFHPITKYCHAARVPRENIYADWEFFNGEEWVETFAGSMGRLEKGGGFGLPVDISAQFSVFYHEGKYRLLTQEGFFGPRIHSFESELPTGPWQNRQLVYTTTETSDVYTYNALIHPEFETPAGYILLSYNINAWNFFDLFENADYYRPKFVWVNYL